MAAKESIHSFYWSSRNRKKNPRRHKMPDCLSPLVYFWPGLSLPHKSLKMHSYAYSLPLAHKHTHTEKDRRTGKIVLARSERRWKGHGLCLCCGVMYIFQTKIWTLSASTFSRCGNVSSRRLTYAHTHSHRVRPAANNKTCLTSLSALLISVSGLCCFCESRSLRPILIFTVCIHKVSRAALYNWELSCDNVWFKLGEVLLGSLLHCSSCCQVWCL